MSCGYARPAFSADCAKIKTPQANSSDFHLSDVLTQFHVPIGEVNEVFPTVVLVEAEIDLHEWTPLGSLRFLHQMQTCFLRSAVRLARVARDAGADNVFPRRRAAAISREDVIQIQVLPIKQMATVLAGVTVALEDVVTRELHFLFRHVVVREEQNDARQSDAK